MWRILPIEVYSIIEGAGNFHHSFAGGACGAYCARVHECGWGWLGGKVFYRQASPELTWGALAPRAVQ